MLQHPRTSRNTCRVFVSAILPNHITPLHVDTSLREGPVFPHSVSLWSVVGRKCHGKLRKLQANRHDSPTFDHWRLLAGITLDQADAERVHDYPALLFQVRRTEQLEKGGPLMFLSKRRRGWLPCYPYVNTKSMYGGRNPVWLCPIEIVSPAGGVLATPRGACSGDTGLDGREGRRVCLQT